MFYYSSRFKKQFKKLSEKIRTLALDRLESLSQNEFQENLNNHKLSGKYSDYRSINITSDFRIVYKRLRDGFYLMAIGSHSELYK